MRRRLFAIATIMAVSMLGVVPAAAADDGSNPAIVREGNQWHLRDSLSGGPATTFFYHGRLGDTQHMLCDWNGDGQQTPGVVRVQDDGTFEWHLRYALRGGAADVTFEFGQNQYDGEFPPAWPVVGNWNGDGGDGVGIVQGHPDGQLNLYTLPGYSLSGATCVEDGGGVVRQRRWGCRGLPRGGCGVAVRRVRGQGWRVLNRRSPPGKSWRTPGGLLAAIGAQP